MADSMMMNPYSSPTSDPESSPNLAAQSKFTPNLLWFVPGSEFEALLGRYAGRSTERLNKTMPD